MQVIRIPFFLQLVFFSEIPTNIFDTTWSIRFNKRLAECIKTGISSPIIQLSWHASFETGSADDYFSNFPWITLHRPNDHFFMNSLHV